MIVVVSRGSSELAIASRMDLSTGPLTSGASATGAIDAKISSASWMTSADGAMRVLAKSGPTSETQKPFQWSTSAFNNISHLGMPDLYSFDWVNFQVATLPVASQAQPRRDDRVALE